MSSRKSLVCYKIVTENLCRGKTTTLAQSSTYADNIASRANDGNRRTTEQYCAHTDPSITDARAWFQVDLGKPFSIKSVTIYYRREGERPSDWKQYRFRQFYLDVSDSPATSTTTSQRTRCYTDNTTAPALPPNIIEIPCKQTARYIIVETKYIYPGDPGPVLEICEIEVNENQCNPGCLQVQCNSDGYCTQGCVNGYWGDTCTEQCPSSCSVNFCYRNGNCYKCKANYTGNNCETRLCPNCYQQVCAQDTGICIRGCIGGYYGNYCSKPCSDRCNPQICDSSTGDCTYNCTNGYYGPKCETPCSTNCSKTSCRKVDGACVNGCQNGYYGLQCRHLCSLQCKNTVCGISNGYCVAGCIEGFYGDFCSLSCSSNCVNRRCNQSNGFCVEGCLPNRRGNTCANKCNESIETCDCLNGKFGEKCLDDCSPGCTSSCERIMGNCTCKEGWQGYRCNECRQDFYGSDCSKKCSSNCLDGHCHAENGSCLGGCKSGFFGEQCTLGFSTIKEIQEGDGISKTSSIIISVISTLFGLTLICTGVKIVLNKRKRRNRRRENDQAISMPACSANSVQEPQCYEQIIDSNNDHPYTEINSFPKDSDYQEIHVYKNTQISDCK
ncbi:protein draper-like isoform X2 [Saccostrea cucullata]|uniref:protein draper-like isoform X2 n=1 Tax=Saccostrea cuccullata TaxID=36930 RepID=UPI002ED66B96